MTVIPYTQRMWRGLSGDAKPTSDTVEGEEFYETDTNNKFAYIDGAWVEAVGVAAEAGEMYLSGNGTAITITDASKPVAVEGFTGGHLVGLTVVASKNGVITGTSNSGGQLRIADVGHGLTTGDIVTINGLATAAQNGITVITTQGVDAFDCDNISYLTAAETGTWQMGSYLLVPTGGAGEYRIIISTSSTAAGTNKTYLMEVIMNTTADAGLKSERKWGVADIGSISLSGFATLADADRVWLCMQGLTDGTNITIKHANFSMQRT